ncbi:MAG: hypothetical protein R2724_30825 [Bryobacterales bacterium]
MMSRQLACTIAGLAFAAAVPLSAQEWLGQKDFLTQHEVDVIRETQEPNERIAAYLHFAALRLELVDQLLAKDEAGRGGKIHDNLDQYGRILEAIDSVVDDALVRDVDLTKGYEALLAQESEMLTRLKGFEERDPEDLWRYEFVLEDAIEITSDSLEMAQGDSKDRKRAILEADDAERAAREKATSDARQAEVDKAKAKVEKKEAEFERKRPTLLKKGESIDNGNGPK